MAFNTWSPMVTVSHPVLRILPFKLLPLRIRKQVSRRYRALQSTNYKLAVTRPIEGVQVKRVSFGVTIRPRLGREAAFARLRKCCSR